MHFISYITLRTDYLQNSKRTVVSSHHFAIAMNFDQRGDWKINKVVTFSGATDYPISDYPADIRPFLGYPGSIEIRLFGIRQYPLSDLLSADPTIGENMGK